MPPLNPIRPPLKQLTPVVSQTVRASHTSQKPTGSGVSIPQGGSLRQFQAPKNRKGRGIVLVGKSGIGKTSLCTEFTNGEVIFVTDNQETGILDLISGKRVTNISSDQVLVIHNFPNLILAADTLLYEAHGAKTIVFESYTGLEKLCAQHVCETRFGDDWGPAGFTNFQAGPRACANKFWPDFIQKLEQLRVSGFNVVLTCHTTPKMASNVESLDYASEQPYFLYKDLWQHTHKWAESLLFYVYQVSVRKEKDGKIKAEGGYPMMVCNRTPQYDAKNKWGIEAPINCDGKSPKDVYLELCSEGRLNPDTLENL